MNAFIDDSKFVNVIREHNIDKDLISKALNVVKQYIIDNQLIIFGGLAIDYALRLYGSSIYMDEELPDYDCLSNTNVDDAYNLGEILNNLGFENVKVIRAKHPETMRVRVNLITVADISYSPLKFYTSYKTLNYKQMRILHPDIQRMDMHLGYCNPFNNAPMEDIFNRWEKDTIRFNLYEQYYPILMTKAIYTTKVNIYKFNKNILKNTNYAIQGFAAYAIYYAEFAKHIQDSTIDKLTINFIDNMTCELEIPDIPDIPFILTTYKSSPEEGQYDKILGYIPDHDRLTINDANFNIWYINYLSIIKINNIQVVNIQYLLVYLLFYYNFYENIQYRTIFGKFYCNILYMINKMEDKSPIFLPSLTYLGPEPLYHPTTYKTDNLPVNYTPSKIGSRQTFNYDNFAISGELKK